MSFKTLACAAAAVITLTLPAWAENTTITVQDAYARSSTKMSKTGAAFMVLMNSGEENDRLIDVRSDAADRVELHTHVSDANGVMQMKRAEDGFPVPAGGMHALARGGDHVMFLGIRRPFEQGETIPLTLVFDKAGEVRIEVPVDLTRKPGMGMQHGNDASQAKDN